MTESRPLGRDEREAKGGGVAEHSHARSNIVALAAPSATTSSRKDGPRKPWPDGWSNQSFGRPERWSRIDQCGVAWLVGERRVIGVTADAITIQTAVRRPASDLSERAVMLGTSSMGRTLSTPRARGTRSRWPRDDARRAHADAGGGATRSCRAPPHRAGSAQGGPRVQPPRPDRER